MSILITDHAGTSGTETVDDLSEVADVIRGWCPDAPADIENAIVELDDALARGDEDQVDGLTALLAVTIEHVGDETCLTCDACDGSGEARTKRAGYRLNRS